MIFNDDIMLLQSCLLTCHICLLSSGEYLLMNEGEISLAAALFGGGGLGGAFEFVDLVAEGGGLFELEVFGG